MKLKTRIKLICIATGLTTVIASTSLMIINTINMYKTNTLNSLEAVNKQTALNLENIIDYMDEAALSPVLNPQIYGIMKKNYEAPRDIQEIYNDNAIISNQLYNNFYYKNKYISSITLILLPTETACYKNRQSRSPNIENWQEQEWYLKLKNLGKDFDVYVLEKDQMYPQKGKLLCLARLLRDVKTDAVIGVIRVDIPVEDLDFLWNDNLLTNGISMEFTDHLGDTLYLDMDNKTIKENRNKQHRLLNVVEHNLKYGYSLSAAMSYSSVYKNAEQALIIVGVIAVLLVIVSFIEAEILSEKTMTPIQKLNHCIKKTKQGDFSVRVEVDSSGDFGEICQSFNSMNQRIEELVEGIYKKEQEKRKAEFLALQAQISPHFLLNTLNSIKFLAYFHGNKMIENSLNDLCKVLSFTFRDTDDKILIRTEIEQLRHYVNILSLRYPNRFIVEFNIDPAVELCYTLKYMVQPFVENSVLHGFIGLEKEGLLRISVTIIDEKVVYEVFDNGQGMSEEQINQILHGEMPKENSTLNRIGIRNVRERIALEYGNDNGITIQSQLGCFTTVLIKIPLELEKRWNKF